MIAGTPPTAEPRRRETADPVGRQERVEQGFVGKVVLRMAEQ